MSTPQPQEILNNALTLLDDMAYDADAIGDELLTPTEQADFHTTLTNLANQAAVVRSDADLLVLADAILIAVAQRSRLREEFLGQSDQASETGQRQLSLKAFKESGKPLTDHYEQRVGITNTIRTQIKSIIEKLLPKEGQRAAG